MSELSARFRVVLEGGEELTQWLNRTNASTQLLERNSNRAFSALSQGAKQTIVDVTRLGSSMAKTALSVSGLSVGLAAQSRGVLEFRDSVQRLATTANIADDQIGGLKDQILNTAVATGQLKEGITEALGAFVAKTGDIETARRNLELYARTAVGTSAALNDVTLIGAELKTKMGISDQRGALGILAKQSDVGAIEFKDLATQGPRLFSAAAGAGLSGEAGVRKIGGLAQIFAEGVGGSGAAARVATSVEGLFRDVSRKQGQARIGALGVDIGNRDAIEITKDVIRKLGGDDRAIQRSGIFTAASMRGVQTLSRTFRETGAFAELDRFTNVAADVGVIDEKFGRNVRTGKSQLAITQARADRAYEKNLGDVIERAAKSSGFVAGSIEWMTEHPGLVAGGSLAALFGRNVLKSLAGGRGGGAGGLIGGALGIGAQRVFVTNWPAGMALPGGVGATGGALGMLAKGGLIAGAGAAGLAAGVLVGEAALKKQDEYDQVRLTGMDIETARLKAQRDAMRRGRVAPQMLDLFSSVGVDIPGASKGELNQVLNITINGDKVSVDGDTGTRKPEVKFRRGGGG